MALTLALVAVALWPWPAQGQDAGEPRWTTREVTLGADALPASLSTRDGAKGMPAVVLVHQLRSTRKEWSDVGLVDALHRAGVATLVVDLRGHGARPAGGKSHQQMGKDDWAKVPRDLQDAVSWLRAQPEVAPERVSLVGGSVGANAAILAFAEDPKIASVVALSAGLPRFKGLDVTRALDKAGTRKVLLVAGTGDSHRAEDARSLAAMAPMGESLVERGGRHGAKLLGSPEVRRRVVEVLVGQDVDPCGWKPTGSLPVRDHVQNGGVAGCGVSSRRDAKSVAKVEVVEIDFRKETRATRVRFVLLDAEGKRVKPAEGKIAYEVLLKRRRKGSARLRDLDVRDGVYTLVLGPDAAPKPCNLHVFVRFDNGTEKLEDWVDDWLFLC